MSNIKSFFIGLFYLFPTLLLAFLAYISFSEKDIMFGIISVSGVFLIGAMSFIAFKQAFSPSDTSKSTSFNNDIPVKDMLVQKKVDNDILVQNTSEQCTPATNSDTTYYCVNCGKKIDINWNFCNHCGNEIKFKS